MLLELPVMTRAGAWIIFFNPCTGFSDTPAQQDDFTKVTGSTVLHKRFCKHRWLENVTAMEHAFEMWSNVNLIYVETVEKGQISNPKT